MWSAHPAQDEHTNVKDGIDNKIDTVLRSRRFTKPDKFGEKLPSPTC